MQRIALPTKDGFEFVSVDDILYLQASGNYCIVTLKNKQSIHIYKLLKLLETQLKSHGFIRIHHEYLININHLNKYNKGDGGEVVMSDGKVLEVSRGKKKEFMIWVKGKIDD